MMPEAQLLTDSVSTTELSILIVDDIQENLDLLRDILEEKGYLVVAAKDGFHALQALRENTVHIIVADAMMPKMDGFELCKEVKADSRFKSIPFIIYTGNYVDEDEKRFAKTLGVDRYVVKYAGLGALMDAIVELAEQHYSAKIFSSSHQDNIDDQAFLEKHHALIVKKLEDKMKELEASEAHYRSFFDHSSIAIFVLDPQTGKILEVNKRGTELLRHSEEELYAMKELPFIDTQNIIPKILSVEKFFSLETLMKIKSGEVIEIEVGVGPIVQPQGRKIIIYVHDITEQKHMRERLLQAEKMSLMGRLASGIAHEIRNPLAAIRLNLQYFMMKNDLDPTQKEALESALDGAQRIDQIVENTLGLARQTPLHIKKENVNEIISKSIWFLRIPAQQKNLKIDGALTESLPEIMVDSKQIQQVFLNIIQNAIDASPQNGIITVNTQILKGSQTDSVEAIQKILVTIKDRGPGLSKEMIAHLFEPFFTTKPGGTGLGLMLSKQILEKHNAEISYEPAEDGGLMAKIIFPTTLFTTEISNG